jgi:hypothetical protein
MFMLVLQCLYCSQRDAWPDGGAVLFLRVEDLTIGDVLKK